MKTTGDSVNTATPTSTNSERQLLVFDKFRAYCFEIAGETATTEREHGFRILCRERGVLQIQKGKEMIDAEKAGDVAKEFFGNRLAGAA